VQDRQKQLSSLMTPRLGDSLMRADGRPWLSGLMTGAPKLDQDNLTQIAALPLNSRLKVDPWDDKVFALQFSAAPLLNARDKMPLEITPVFYRLQRYVDPATATPATATPPPAGPATTPPAADTAPVSPADNAQTQPQTAPPQ